MKRKDGDDDTVSETKRKSVGGTTSDDVDNPRVGKRKSAAKKVTEKTDDDAVSGTKRKNTAKIVAPEKKMMMMQSVCKWILFAHGQEFSMTVVK